MARASDGYIRGAHFWPFDQPSLGPDIPCYLDERNQGKTRLLRWLLGLLIITGPMMMMIMTVMSILTYICSLPRVLFKYPNPHLV